METPQKKFDDIIHSTIGDFGKWQLKISTLMALLKFPIAWFQLGIIFLAPPTQFWCNSIQEYTNLTTVEWLALKPFENVSLQEEGLNTGFCRMVNLKNSTNDTIACINGYDYNTTVFHSSIVTEWDLVCDNKRLVDLSQISLMLGVLIGNILFGVLADRRGRKETLLTCICLQSIFGVISACMPWYSGFILTRFLLAVANGGTIVISFVMCMEVVGGKWRTIVPILYQIPFGFGTSTMAAMAYFYRDWRDLQLAISLISSLFILYIWLIPESPRWLSAIGRQQEAVKILQKAAEFNNIDSIKIRNIVTNLQEIQPKTKTSISTLFSTKEMNKRSLLLCINWLISGVIFYAFSQYAGKVGRNIYLTTTLSGFIAFPGTVLCIYIIRKFGRRYTIAIAHLLTAICCFSILLIPLGVYKEDWPRVLIAALGIIGLSVSMPALYLFTGELFPTIIRNAGVGTCVMFSRIGSMIAPMVITLQDISTSLPLLVLGFSAIIEILLILPLPETKGVLLPETLEDIEIENKK